jgi:hypothetical protein
MKSTRGSSRAGREGRRRTYVNAAAERTRRTPRSSAASVSPACLSTLTARWLARTRPAASRTRTEPVQRRTRAQHDEDRHAEPVAADQGEAETRARACSRALRSIDGRGRHGCPRRPDRRVRPRARTSPQLRRWAHRRRVARGTASFAHRRSCRSGTRRWLDLDALQPVASSSRRATCAPARPAWLRTARYRRKTDPTSRWAPSDTRSGTSSSSLMSSVTALHEYVAPGRRASGSWCDSGHRKSRKPDDDASPRKP